MESGNLQAFFEVVRCGSFSKAADLLFVTQSAVSRRVKQLEERLGCRLIDRGAPSLEPTEAGHIVYESAGRMLALEQELLRQIKELNTRPALAFACTRPFGSAYLPAILKRYLEKFEKKAEFSLSFDTPSGALQGLRDNNFDLICLEHGDDLDFTSFDTIGIGRDEMVFISAPALGLPAGEVAVDQLLPHRLYRRKEECCSGKLLSLNMAAIGRDSREFGNILLYDDLQVIIDSVLAGDGISFISRSRVHGHLREGRLREHKVAGFIHERDRTLAYRRHHQPSEAFDYFLTCVLEAFETAGDAALTAGADIAFQQG